MSQQISLAFLRDLDAALRTVQAERMVDLGVEESGLGAHYERLLGRGTFYRPCDHDRLNYITGSMPGYDHYVVYRAGLGEMAFALAIAGLKVTAWQPNNRRRDAMEAARDAIAGQFPAVLENLTIAGEEPHTIVVDPEETSLGLAFDMVYGGVHQDEVETSRALFTTNALLYEYKVFLKSRDAETAAGECQAILGAIGFERFKPVPVTGLAMATRGERQPERARLPLRSERGQAITPEGACKGLFAIVGSSFSGSTLLNTLLGAHPKIAGGGELHWLAKHTLNAVCSFCGVACKLWTPQVRDYVDGDNLYDVTATVFDRPFVCDASKMPAWFSSMLEIHANVPQANILLVKHPVRHVASFLHKASFQDRLERYRDPQVVLRHLYDFYHSTVRTLPIDRVVRYEDLVADTRGQVEAILGLLGLEWDDAIDGWQTAVHHHIGGNSGPRVQIDRSKGITDLLLRRKYDRAGVFMDDTWLEILDEATFEAISADPLALDICEMFGYEPLAWPRPSFSAANSR